jgi:enoyl-[acyl-carrier protein] reductase III
MTLEGKLALVTGSSRGIGRAVAARIARLGADVAVHYLNNREGAEATADLVSKAGRRAFTVQAHLKHPEEIERLFEEVSTRFGGLDILVNNAASGKLCPVTELSVKGWEWTMDINARAALLCSQQAARLMEPRGSGRIVNITSMGSQRTIPDYAAVGASKAALEALTRYLAVELAPRGIVVNCVCAGLIETDALRHFPNREEMIAQTRTRVPMGRLGTPEDIAKIVGFLVSEDGGWICGQTIVGDGGYGLLS